MKRSGPIQRRTRLQAKKPMRARRKATTKLRASARGQPCMVQAPVPGGCWGPETTVLAHRNGAGMGMKASDEDAAYACFACHAWLDGGYVRTHTRAQRDEIHEKAILRTREERARPKD